MNKLKKRSKNQTGEREGEAGRLTDIQTERLADRERDHRK